MYSQYAQTLTFTTSNGHCIKYANLYLKEVIFYT